jgi:hypothetical protein
MKTKVAVLLLVSIGFCVNGFALMHVTGDRRIITSGSLQLESYTTLEWQHTCTGSEVGKNALLKVTIEDSGLCKERKEIDVTVTIFVNGNLYTSLRLLDSRSIFCDENHFDSLTKTMAVSMGTLQDGMDIEVSLNTIKGDTCDILITDKDPAIDSLEKTFIILGVLGIIGIVFALLITLLY